MRCGFCWAGGLLLLAVALPTAAADDKPTFPPPEPEKGKEKLVAVGQFIGHLAEVGGTEKTLKLQVPVNVPVVNADAVKRHMELQGKLLEALGIPNPGDRLKRIRELQGKLLENQRKLVTLEERLQDVPLPLGDEVKVRVLFLPLYDDKGNYRQYSAKELKELKGPDTKLPGFTADVDRLSPGQVVYVLLARKVPEKKDKDAGPPPESKPEVALIVILAEAAG